MFSGVKDYFGSLSKKGIAAWVGGTVAAVAIPAGLTLLYKFDKWPFNSKKGQGHVVPAVPAVPADSANQKPPVAH